LCAFAGTDATRRWRGDAVRLTIVPDQVSSAVYGMPKAAANMNAAVDILSIERIAPRLVEVFARSDKRRA
jgi:two-component system response regulator WspF